MYLINLRATYKIVFPGVTEKPWSVMWKRATLPFLAFFSPKSKYSGIIVQEAL